METTKIPLSSCIESKHQNRKEPGDVSGLARSIEVNGQITPLIVVADGDAYQLVAGHRRTAAMKSLGLEEADAYVMDGWDDARIAQVLNAENNHRKELTEAERGRGIQTMLSLGVPVSDAAVSADVPEEKAESYVRGTKLVPVDAVNLDSVEVPVSEVGEGDQVWMRVVGDKWKAFPVVGFGQPNFNRIAVTIDTPDGKRDVIYPDLPYVAMYDHDGDFSWNCNNYVHGNIARIKPRMEQLAA